MITLRRGSPDHWANAAEAHTAGLTIAVNDHGTPVSVHRCTTCNTPFTVCPPSTRFGNQCLAPSCDSYDPARDPEPFFPQGA